MGHDLTLAAVRPRDAATVVLVRPGPSGQPAVLMGRRSRRAAFAPDVFVFPGGRAEAGDEHLPVVAPLHADEAARLAAAGAAGPLMARRLASAAIRETWEETGYLIGASTAENDALRPDHSALRFSARAITPRESPIRFHARFFLADGTALTAARCTPFVTSSEYGCVKSGTISPITFVRRLRMLRAARLDA